MNARAKRAPNAADRITRLLAVKERKRRITLRELFDVPTQSELARFLDVNQSVVSRMLAGTVTPNGRQLQRIAEYFGISADSIDLTGYREKRSA